MNVDLRPEASGDLVSAAAYFDDISDGWGATIFSIQLKSTLLILEITNLSDEAGVNVIHRVLPCKFAKVFPFAIDYRIEADSALFYAI